MLTREHNRSTLSIRKRIILFVVLPVVLGTFFLNYYLTIIRLDDADTNLELKGELISGYLVIAAEYGLFTGDKESLQRLVNFTTRKPDITNIIIYDRAREIITQANVVEQEMKVSRFASIFFKERKPITISKEVKIAGFNVFYDQDSFAGNTQFESNNEKIIGWIDVVLSPRSLILQQQQILTSSVFVALLSLLLGILLSLQTERLVTRPILQLARTIKSIRNGEFSLRTEESLSGELGLLERGLNEMAIALGEQHEQLREKVADATVELTTVIDELESKNKQLEVSQLQVTKASHAKEEFLARMSHEIRTPMNAVIGYATLLKQTDLAHVQQEYTRIIERAAHQLLTIIDDILIFTKLESGAVAIENIRFDLQESLEDVISMLSQSAHDKSLELVLLIYSDVPILLKGDPIRINQILINLVNNAIKFTESGSIVVHVEVSQETTDFTELLISVDDSGPGINESQVEQLFEEFSQADSTITRRFGGTGLGLPIAKKLAELMQGSIGVDSAPGEGSKFWFRVKCENLVDKTLVPHNIGLAAKKILVCDNNLFSARAIRNNLLKWDINVFTARSISKSIGMFTSAQNENAAIYDFAIFGLTLDDCTDIQYQTILSDIRAVYQGPLLFLVGKEPQNLPTVFSDEENIDCGIRFQRKPIPRWALHKTICQQLELSDSTVVKNIIENETTAVMDCNILVVEDNAFNRELVSTLLQAKGIIVHLAENAKQAINIVKNNTLDLILMDIHLPDMSGLEVAKKVREIKSNNKSIPIIALTADVFIDKNHTLREATVDDCIIKPISESKFWDVITKYLPNTAINVKESNGFPALDASQKNSLVKNIKVLLESIEKTIPDKKWPLLSEHVHQLKGLAAYYQLHALNDTISAMELSLSKTNINELSVYVKRAFEIILKFETV